MTLNNQNPLGEMEETTSIDTGDKTPSKKRAIISVIVIFVILLIVGITITFSILGKDEPPIDDKDLRPIGLNIPEEENAFYCFTRAAEEINLPEGKLLRDYFKEDLNSLGSLIENNDRAFTAFEACLGFEVFQSPLYSNIKEFWVGSVLSLEKEAIDSGDLILLKSKYLFEQNKKREALDEVLKALELGHLIESSQGPATEYLSGHLIKERALELLREFALSAQLPPELLKEYVRSLEKYKDEGEGLARAMKMEYISLVNTKTIALDNPLQKDAQDIMDIRKDMPKLLKWISSVFKSYYYKPNKTHRILAEHAATQIANASIEFYKDYKEPVLEMKEIEIPESKIRQLFTENIFGRAFLEIALVDFPGSYARRLQETFSITATQVLFAIKAYSYDKGILPPSLEALVPNYIDEVPLDPFDAQPLRYSAQKGIVYSVGENLLDEGGIETEKLETKEPTIRVNLKE